MQHLEGSGTPVLYVGRRVLKGQRGAGGLLLSMVEQDQLQSQRLISSYC